MRSGNVSAYAVIVGFATLAVGCFGYNNPDSKLVKLDDSTFHAFVEDSYEKPVIVEFFAPWCGHCKAFAPQYDQAATKLADVAKFGLVDATAHRDLAVAHHVKGYPTVVWFKNGATNHRHYQGPQSVEGLTHLVQAITSDPVTVLETVAQVEAFKAENTISYVLFSSTDAREIDLKLAKESFSAACGAMQDVTDCAAITGLARSDIPDNLAIAAVRFESFDAGTGPQQAKPIVFPLDGTVQLEREAAPRAIKEWIDSFHLPLIAEVTGKNFALVTRAGKKAVLIACADQAMANKIRSVAYTALHPTSAAPPIRGFLARYNFGTFVLADERAEKYMEKFGISKANLPEVVALDYDRDRYYYAKGYKATADGLTNFVNDLARDHIPEQGLSMVANLDMKWEAVVRVLPFLRALDVLPRFSLIMIGVLLALGLVFWSILRSDSNDSSSSQAPKKKPKKKSKKNQAPTEDGKAEADKAVDSTTKEHID